MLGLSNNLLLLLFQLIPTPLNLPRPFQGLISIETRGKEIQSLSLDGRHDQALYGDFATLQQYRLHSKTKDSQQPRPRICHGVVALTSPRDENSPINKMDHELNEEGHSLSFQLEKLCEYIVAPRDQLLKSMGDLLVERRNIMDPDNPQNRLL
jgi:hypothetical protein